MKEETKPPAADTKPKLWNINFFLLWQGQLVSALGDVAYSIALGFWILAVTGSTALMGTLMAASSLPRVLISPFAGVVVDRSDRKWLLVTMDVIRGVFVVFIGIASYLRFIEIWMVFAAGMIIGACGAFFNPAVSSIIPDIVDKRKLVQANSVFNIIQTASGIMGSSAGGILFKVLGASFLFLFNGLSYIFSAFTEVFIKVPKIIHEKAKLHFFADMKDGLRFVWHFRGLRTLITIAGLINFFAVMGIMLILPLFHQEKHLGPVLYGIIMGFFTGGLFLGFLFTSLVEFKPERRFMVFSTCYLLMCGCMILLPVHLYFPLMAALVFLTGFVNAILNTFINTVMQLTTPQDKRGKVFGLLTSIAGGLMPVAFALGGVLAEFFSIRLLISASFTVVLLCYLPMLLSASFRRYVQFDPVRQTLQDIV
ncbi:MAG: MFS transporter [candidate division WOR-3 bacterium]|nr:MAG: MFS transporter [candidate division WOR-3 bacterium]